MMPDRPPIQEPTGESFAVAVIPDTQRYSERNPAAFEVQTRWLAQHREEENIAFVFHEGDVVNAPEPEQFERADRALTHLAENDVPYLLAIGNHDYDNFAERSADTFEEFFPTSRFADRPWWGDSFDGTAYNAYVRFKTLGDEYIALTLEPFPREAVVDWAEEVLETHSDHTGLLLTHGYLYRDGTPIDAGDKWDRTAYEVSGHNGDRLWERFISRQPNLRAVFSGHVLTNGSGGTLSTDENDFGERVHQLLTNYQSIGDGGRGYLRLVRFFPAADAITIETYSPLLKRYHEDAAHHFRIGDAFGPGV